MSLFSAGWAAVRGGGRHVSHRRRRLVRRNSGMSYLLAAVVGALLLAGCASAQRSLAASYPTGTVTVPGEMVSQNAAVDEQNRKLQDLRARLVKSRQEQQRLRAKLRAINSNLPAAR